MVSLSRPTASYLESWGRRDVVLANLSYQTNLVDYSPPDIITYNALLG